jgi:hypothetical protein
MATNEGLPASTPSSGCVFHDLEVPCRAPHCTVCNKTCLECGQDLHRDEPSSPVPGYPGRFAHRYCRGVVLSVAFQAVGK